VSAVVAYKEAMKERTRERCASDWADTRNQLGIALKTLGRSARKKGTEFEAAG